MARNSVKYLVFLLMAGITVAACGRSQKGTSNEDGEGTAVTGTRGNSVVVELSDSLILHHRADTIAFGRVRQGENVSGKVIFRNVGEDPIAITQIEKSCGCISFDYDFKPLRPGNSGEMTLRFDSRGLGGKVFKTLGVRTSLNDNAYILVVTADVV